MSGELLEFAERYLHAVCNSVVDEIPTNAKRRRAQLLSHGVAFGDVYEALRAPLREVPPSGIFRLFPDDDDERGNGYIDLLATRAYGARTLHDSTIRALQTPGWHRVWLILEIASGTCKALTAFDIRGTSEILVRSLCVMHRHLESRYHEVLLCLLVLFADQRGYSVRLEAEPRIDVCTLAVGWLGFLREAGSGALVRPAMVEVCPSRTLAGAIRSQFTRLVAEQGARLSQSTAGCSRTPAGGTERSVT